MSILDCVFSFIINWNTNCYKWKNAFLQRTSTKTILTKKENFRELQASKTAGKCAFWKRKMRNGEKWAKRFFSAIFSRVKICKFLFCVVKIKVIGTIAAVLQMYTFLGAVYICNAHFGGWVSDVLERSRAERSRSDERSKERENDGLPKWASRHWTKSNADFLNHWYITVYLFICMRIAYILHTLFW